MTEIPRPKHPRPDKKREEWQTLNGTWDFQFDPLDQGKQEGWQKPAAEYSDKITVPFPWQSGLSGIEDTGYTGAAWYQRNFDLKSGWEEKKVFIRFGAVDYFTDLWVNGTKVGTHEGGYDQFSFEITKQLKEGSNNVALRVEDPEDISEIPHGKQGGEWYTRISGVWQPVWLEAVSETYIQDIQANPSLEKQKCELDIQLSSPPARGKLEISIQEEGKEEEIVLTLQADSTDLNLTVNIENPRPWKPEAPHLYDVEVSLKREGKLMDRLKTYFGMRDVATKNGKIYLNGDPIYLLGALDQAYHPEGLYTYPGEKAMKKDISLAKEAGFNLLRLHIKPDEPRFLYNADRMGMLVWEEPANFGDEGYGEKAKKRFQKDLKKMIKRDFNHPSIIIWGCFNETWGLRSQEGGRYAVHGDKEKQEYITRTYELAKDLDDSRLVVDNSPCNEDHVVTDLNDWHAYWEDYGTWKEEMYALTNRTFPGSQWNYVPGKQQGKEPMINSEYGAVAAHMGDLDVSMPFRFTTNELRKYEKCAGYIYTELQDIEWEKNGVYRYDRSRKEFGYDIKDINSPDYIVIDYPPAGEVNPGERLEIPVKLSLYSGKVPQEAQLNWKIEGVDRFGNSFSTDLATKKVEVEHHRAYSIGKLDVRLPNKYFAGRLKIRLSNDDQKFAENFVGLAATADGWESKETKGTKRVQLEELNLGEYRTKSWEGPGGTELLNGKVEAVYGGGSGHFVYQLDARKIASPEEITRMEFLAELSSYCPGQKQTGTKNHPTDAKVKINDITVGRWLIPDRPIDSRGTLSWLNDYKGGAYGYLKKAVLPQSKLDRIKRSLVKEDTLTVRLSVPNDRPIHPGGLTIYGRKLGRFPLGPAIKVEYG
ncbi:beta galactosidase jelly roll domain-containing protein [Candidatus Bipolaricaulota bacterium]|nr:beta galactosidase jelly roll domain-containing protein [Candidatus Bipolaricaulota bacterium]